MRKLLAALLICSAPVFAQAPKASPAKPFAIERPGATPISLAEYRGKVVMLVFISTGCSHCQDFTRSLIPIAGEYAPRGVQFLECAVNGDAATSVPAFVEQFHPPFPVGFSTQSEVDNYLKRSFMMTFYVPHAVFLDRSGKIVDDYPGESDFMKNPATNTRAELDKLLAPAPVRKTVSRAKTAGDGSR